MPFIVAGVLLALFVANVTIGAISAAPIVGNVAEMLILFAASIFFVAGILQREAAEKKHNNNNH